MRLLLLTKKFPFPLNDGESVAVHNMATELHRLGVTIDILSFNTTKHYTEVEKYRAELSVYNEIFTIDLDNSINKIEAFKNLFSKKSFHIDRFNHPEYRQQLIRILQNKKYDIIQLESIFLAPYLNDIRKYTRRPIVLRTHNIEHIIWNQITYNTTGVKKIYLKEQSIRLKEYEQKMWAKFDSIIPMSEIDASHLAPHTVASIDIIPISLEQSEYNNTPGSINELSFIGSLDWMPNIEGIDWMLDEVWDKVITANPDAELHIAGKNAPQRYDDVDKIGVEFIGAVDDAIDFISKYDTMIVPLKSGSGLRVKILEAMALGKVIISTSVGMEGIAAIPNQDYLLADTTEEFVLAILKSSRDAALRSKLSINSKKVFENNYRNDLNGMKFLKVYQKITKANSRRNLKA